MWEKEDKEESEGDEDKWLQEIPASHPSPYKWPCSECEDQMIEDGHTFSPLGYYTPFGYSKLTKQEIAEIKKEKK